MFIPLVGPPFTDPLAVKILDNRLYISYRFSKLTTLIELMVSIRLETLNCLFLVVAAILKPVLFSGKISKKVLHVGVLMPA